MRHSAPRATPPQYCCLGCQLAADITSDTTESDSESSRTALQLGLAVFFSMNVMVFTVALWSWDTYSIATSDNAAILKDLLRLACLLFATPVVLILGRPLVTNVAQQLRLGVITTDCLLVVGVAAAFCYSVVSVVGEQDHIYFEVACMILVAVTLGRWLEAEGKHRAMKSLQSLQNLLPETARVVNENGSQSVEPLANVSAGRVIRVLPGERVPLDGTVQIGQSYVDQQLVTGESRAVSRSPGDEVFGGTANLDGCLDIRVDANAASGMIQRLVESVHEAASRASRPQRLADRLATVFVPLVFVIALLVFVTHWKTTDMQAAFMSSMAVALIACPCALAIATPLAIWAALGNAAKQGVVFRTSDDLMALSAIDYICIDKTGTVTTDQPRLAGSWYQEGSEKDAVDITRQLSSQTMHPLGRALDQQLCGQVAENGMSIGPTTMSPGKGISGQLTIVTDDNTMVTSLAAMGSGSFCIEKGLRFSDRLRKRQQRAIDCGQSVVCVGWHRQVRAVFGFEESLRGDAFAAVEALHGLGLRTLLLTGDQVERASRIASELGLAATAQLLPGEKQDVIAQLQARGHKVAMMGDGLNDAPALCAADIGIALGCGAEITRDAADVCLLSSRLVLVPWVVELSRVTRRTIRRNLIWAMAYNGLGIALAATGQLNPIFAALAMVFSSGFVIAESLRLSTRPGPLTSDARQVRMSAEIRGLPHALEELTTIGASGT